MSKFKQGDKVSCHVGHYKSYNYGEEASVLEVFKDKIKLQNYLTEDTCWYLAENWTLKESVKEVRQKEAQLVGFARTQYFALQIDPNQVSGSFIPLKDPHKVQTVTRQNKHEVLEDIKSVIREGEKWIILQTVALVEPEAPKMRVTVTELK